MHNRLGIALIASMSLILFGCATSLPPEGREKAVGEKNAFPEPRTGSEVSLSESERKEIFKEIIAAEDKARIELVSINGNKVGGSKWLAGSLIYVQKD